MVDKMDNFNLSPPLDLSHHFSDISRHREPSAIKGFYKYFTIPGIGNLAGGLPNPGYFPFDTLESSTAIASRFNPTPVSDPSDSVPPKQQSKPKDHQQPSLNDPTPRHLLVPHDSKLPSKLDRIDLSTALQYGTAQGYPPLATFIRKFALNHLHPNIPYKNGAEIILTCGNTDGFAKTIEGFTDPWSTTCGRPKSERQGLLCEEYAYMNAIQTARPRGLNIVPIAVDAEGMLAYGHKRCLYNVLTDWNVERDGGRRPHIMYTVTMGQNPTSGLLSVKRRKEIYEICQKFDILIVEDDPYYYIQFPHVANELSQKWRDGELASPNHFAEANTNYQTNLAVPVRGTVDASSVNGQNYRTTRMRKGISSGYPFLDSLVPSFLSLDVDGRVIRLDTFSKTIAPGCRLGWVTAQPAFIDVLLRITEVSTQQPSGFVQSIVAELLIGPDHKELYENMKKDKKRGEQSNVGWKMDGWVRWLEGLRGNYERRMRIMAEVFEEGKITVVSKRARTTSNHRDKQQQQATPPSSSSTRIAYRSRTNATTSSSNEPLSSASNLETDSDTDPFEHLTKTPLYTFNVPQAGMFFWIHMNFPSHPLSPSQTTNKPSPFTNPQLSLAFWVYQTRAPNLILTAPGTIFAPTEQIRLDSAWQYFRICFAAVDESEVKGLSGRFVEAARKFWEIEDEEEIWGLLRDGEDPGVVMELEKREGVLSGLGPHMC